MIDEKEVTAYVTIPDCFLQGCSEDIVIFRADGGNHFTDYGIYEGMFLFFDRKKRFKKIIMRGDCPFAVTNGVQVCVIRDKFIDYLDKQFSI